MVDVAAFPKGLVRDAVVDPSPSPNRRGGGGPACGESLKGVGFFRPWGILVLAGCLSTGCITIEVTKSPPAEKKEASTEKKQAAVKEQPAPCQMVIHWHNEVMHTPDGSRDGALMPVLVGRIYLFGQTLAIPLEVDGAVAVELFNLNEVVPAGTEGTPEGGPRRLEKWIIDPVTLQKLKRKDPIGWGYNLALPWTTYKPELTKLQMRVCYQPAKGNPIYETSTLVLGSLSILDPPTVSKNVPGAPLPGVADRGHPAGGSAAGAQASLWKPPSSPTSPLPGSTLLAPGVRSWTSPAIQK